MELVGKATPLPPSPLAYLQGRDQLSAGQASVTDTAGVIVTFH